MFVFCLVIIYKIYNIYEPHLIFISLLRLTEEYRANFKASFAKDVASHLVSPTSSNHGGYGGISDEDDEMGERTSHSKFIPNKRADISKKKNSILSIQEEIKATHKKTKQAEEDTVRFTREMESKQLDKVKMDGERQVAAKKKSLEAEIQRNRGVKDSVQVARANSGAYAQQIAEKVCVLFGRGMHVFVFFIRV